MDGFFFFTPGFAGEVVNGNHRKEKKGKMQEN